MAARHILSALAIVFFALAAVRLARDGGRLHPQSRTWFLIGIIFAAVSAWLFSRD